MRAFFVAITATVLAVSVISSAKDPGPARPAQTAMKHYIAAPEMAAECQRKSDVCTGYVAAALDVHELYRSFGLPYHPTALESGPETLSGAIDRINAFNLQNAYNTAPGRSAAVMVSEALGLTRDGQVPQQQ